MNVIQCKNCRRERENHAKGYCITCYKKIVWKPKRIICKRCKREADHHSKNFCAGCYNFIFHLEKIKEFNYKKWHNLNIETYKRIIKECVLCGFDKIVDLHHLDENRSNNSERNLIGLCPNHHKMIHNFQFRKEIRELLTEKGFNLSEDIKLDFKLK